MTLLPIVVRELRVAARRRSTFFARFGMALTAIGVGCYLLLALGLTQGFGRPIGTWLFQTLTTIAFLFCLALGYSTADCISEEKREGTLGFLFLTDLKGHDIAFGKLFSTSLVSFYAILGILPIVAVSLLFGGVSAAEFWHVVVALLNAFFFFHAAGLFVSTFSRKRASAIFTCMTLFLIYILGFYLLSAAWSRRWTAELEMLNPAYCVFRVLNGGFMDYWTSFITVNLNAWVFLAISCLWVPRCWKEKSGRKDIPWPDRLARSFDRRFALRDKLIDINPFCWLVSRNQFGSLKTWVTLFVINALWAWALHKNDFRDAGMPIFVGTILSNHLAFKFLFAARAAGTLEEQRHSGALEFLVSCCPLSVQDFAGGQWMALRRLFQWPLLAILTLDFLMVLLIVTHPHLTGSDMGSFQFALFVGATVLMLIFDAVAVGWIGMWNAMRQRRRRAAAGGALSLVLILPWLMLMFFMFVAAFSRHPLFDSGWAFLFLWLFFGMAVDIPAIIYCRRRFLTEFRERAAAPFGEDPGVFGWLGRLLGTFFASKPPKIQV